MDATEDSNPPRCSSPPLEISQSTETGSMPNSGRAATSSRATVAVNSVGNLKRPDLYPAPKLTKGRVDDIKEGNPGQKNFDEDAAWAESLRQQLKLHYVRNKFDTMEAKELLYELQASSKFLYCVVRCFRYCTLHRSEVAPSPSAPPRLKGLPHQWYRLSTSR